MQSLRVSRALATPATHSRVRGSAVVRPAAGSRRLSVSPSALFDLKGLLGGLMGNKSSSPKGWEPAPSKDVPRKTSRSGFDVTPLTTEERARAAEELPKMAQYVALEHGTERAFTGKTVNGYSHDNKQRGVYVSALGGLPLFSSDTKFNSGTGWPSFFAPVDPEHIIEVTDTSIPYMPRVEVLDRRSGAHLGHVFNDGPAPTGKRYCINAAALKFIPEGEVGPQ